VNKLGLGDPMRKGRPLGQPQRQRQRLGLQHLGRMQGVPETPTFALIGAHHPAGEQKLGRAALTDDPGQHGAGTHVTTRQPDAGEQERAFRSRCRQPQVRGHGKDRARPHRHPVHRRDDRLAAGDHRLDQIAGHPGECQQVLRRLADQGADDVMHIAAGTEIAAV